MEITVFLALLADQYPQVFVHEGQAPSPLAIGIGEELAAMCGDAPLVHAALRLYTRRRGYQQALAQPGTMRVDLQGQPVGPVSPEHQRQAQAWLASGPRRKSAATRPTLADDIATITKGLKPMLINAVVKFVLRDIPPTRESQGMVYFPVQNCPRGLPAGVTLPDTPLAVACPTKQWKRALTQAAAIRGTGVPALLVIEGHLGQRNDQLLALVKGIQVVAGKTAAAVAGQ